MLTVKEALNVLKQAAGNNEIAQSIVGTLQHAADVNPDLTCRLMVYWLFEKIYYTLGWEKRHMEEGALAKAEAERQEADAAQILVDALQKALEKDDPGYENPLLVNNQGGLD